jgi:hypothetical protein
MYGPQWAEQTEQLPLTSVEESQSRNLDLPVERDRYKGVESRADVRSVEVTNEKGALSFPARR